MTAPPPPSTDEFGGDEDLFFVRVKAGAKPDNFNRIQFTAYWLDDYLPPDGVRAQVFFTDLDQWTADAERRGGKVRRWSPEGGVQS